MVYKSPFPDIDIPESNILSYIFPPSQTPSDEALWIDAQNPKHSLSPRQALHWIKRLGSMFDVLGVGVGKVVLIMTPNHIFVPVAYLGIVGAGRVFSGVNPVYTINEVEFQMRNTEAELILVHPSLLDTAVKAAKKVGLAKERILQFSDRECELSDGVRDWRTVDVGGDDKVEGWKWDEMRGERAKKTAATINYSSGTTGLPKGVAVSHYNIVSNSEQTIVLRDAEQSYSLDNKPAERWLGFLPLYHAFGQLYACVMAPKLLHKIYIMSKFVYTDFLESIQQHRITHLQTAPPILVMLDKRPETSKYDLSSLENILCGAAPLSKELQNSVAKKFKVNIVQGWGMTEVTCGAIHCPGGRYDDSGSVGVLDPNCEVKLLDDDGNEVVNGNRGEICVRGPQVCLGYWRNEKATKETLDEDGWLKTGDIALCEDGWFWIVDRKKELIKVNGLQVAPAELEAVLLEHDQIADAAVVGITLGHDEWPRAYVALQDEYKGKTTAEEIQNWVKGRVAKHKALVGGVTFIDEVPKLASGKIQRKVMRDWAKRDAADLQKAKL